MPRATVASRELKNKDTGLDLFVPTYKEIKGRLSSTVYYQVVVVTNLSFFKTPSHKETDVVQCSVEKKWADFEELRMKLSEAFHGTMLPMIDKKSFIVNDLVLRERRNNLEAFLKFIASVSKLAKSAPVLQFLGVDAVRANKTKQEDLADGNKQIKDTEEVTNEAEPDVDVFGETKDQQDGGDLFEDEDEPAFGFANDESERQDGSFSMFEAQDMKPEIDEEDEKAFNFIPDAIITKKEKVALDPGLVGDEEEEREKQDLFQIEDDLDQLLVVDIEKPKKKATPVSEVAEAEQRPSKPSVATKPKPAAKPTVPSKPRVSQSGKPAVPPKKSSQTALHSQQKQDGHQSASAAVDTMQQDDLLAYLQENLTSNTEEADLFS
ncbi:hcls1-binding protein 3-like [Plakobranchus ocellatus]|uniref:Hcls1-binding protein 3-like n=1 Tax=Plakobranchus ocellatus TaxID=259542 RepID=A0AAV4DQF7_9GAST|nr:hcls1-binding protein 3-like [Plakobranchus ocellatus]